MKTEGFLENSRKGEEERERERRREEKRECWNSKNLEEGKSEWNFTNSEVYVAAHI